MKGLRPDGAWAVERVGLWEGRSRVGGRAPELRTQLRPAVSARAGDQAARAAAICAERQRVRARVPKPTSRGPCLCRAVR